MRLMLRSMFVAILALFVFFAVEGWTEIEAPSLSQLDAKNAELLTQTAEESFDPDVAERIASYRRSHRVIGSLTTSPKRLHLLHLTLATIKDIPYLDEIVLALPQKYGRSDEAYDIPDWLFDRKRYPKLTIIRPEYDLGPISKLIPAVRYAREKYQDPDTVIITFDDDVGYAKDTVRQLLKRITEQDNLVVSGSVQPLSFWKIYHSRHWSQFAHSIVVEGFAAIAYRVKFVDDAWMEATVRADRHCKFSDDLVISYGLDRSGISRGLVRNRYAGYHKNILFSHTFDDSALHRGGGLSNVASSGPNINAEKYLRCNEYLKSSSVVSMGSSGLRPGIRRRAVSA